MYMGKVVREADFVLMAPVCVSAASLLVPPLQMFPFAASVVDFSPVSASKWSFHPGPPCMRSSARPHDKLSELFAPHKKTADASGPHIKFVTNFKVGTAVGGSRPLQPHCTTTTTQTQAAQQQLPLYH